MTSRTVETGLGPVELVGVADLDRWIAKQGTGVVGPDFALTLAQELHRLARARDKAAVSGGWLIRRLARVR